jgi:hypothetical protein
MEQLAEGIALCGIRTGVRRELQCFGEAQFVERVAEPRAARCGVEAGLIDAEGAGQDQ